MLPRAHIYVWDEDNPIIVSPLHRNDAGIFYEQEVSITLHDATDIDALGAALRAAVKAFSILDRNLRDWKKSDWPAYRASGFRSIREFESRYLLIDVNAVNEAEFYSDASAQPRGEEEITLHVTLNPHVKFADEEMGRKILRLFEACSKWSI